HRAAGKGHAARRFVSDLDSLTVGGEGHRMVADNIAGAHGGEADSVPLAGPGLALTTVHRHLLEVATEGAGHHFAHAESRAGGGIDLVAMMGLVDLDIHVVSQYPR